MSTIINGTSSAITFPDSTVQNTAYNSSTVIGYSQLPTGSVLQVVSAIKTDTASFTSSTFSDVTGLSVSITPKFSTSKILVIANVNCSWRTTNAKIGGRLMRNSTPIAVGDAASSRTQVTGVAYWNIDADTTVPLSMTYLDSPSTTSATTYKWQANNMDNSGLAVYINRSTTDTDAFYFGRTPSSITVMEIAG